MDMRRLQEFGFIDLADNSPDSITLRATTTPSPIPGR